MMDKANETTELLREILAELKKQSGTYSFNPIPEKDVRKELERFRQQLSESFPQETDSPGMSDNTPATETAELIDRNKSTVTQETISLLEESPINHTGETLWVVLYKLILSGIEQINGKVSPTVSYRLAQVCSHLPKTVHQEVCDLFQAIVQEIARKSD